MLEKIQEFSEEQRAFYSLLKEEKFDGLHSALRAKNLIYAILELEVKIDTLTDAYLKQKDERNRV